MRREHVLAVIAAVGVAAIAVTQAQQPAPTGPNVVQIEKVKDNVAKIYAEPGK